MALQARQARSRKTERSLLDAAEGLLARREFDTIAIPEITDRAGFSVGTFYRRFTDKEDLFDALFDRFERQARSTFGEPEALLALAPERALVEIVRRIRAVYAAHGGLIRALQRRAQSDPERYRRAGTLIGETAAAIAAVVAPRGRRPSASQRRGADIAARLVFALCDQELAFGAMPPSGQAWDESAFTRALGAFCFRALAPTTQPLENRR